MESTEIVKSIYQQFVDYFGEDKVDLQNYNSAKFKITSWEITDNHFNSNDWVIIVHWPVVKVSNEFDESVEIWDLYAITIISSLGDLRGKPYFNRSTYDRVQWVSDYAHSHLSGINKNNLKEFRPSCLGSGPINGTIRRLHGTDYTDLDIWNLYIWELDKYVHVESISGVPYRKIRNIGVAVAGGSDGCIRDFQMICSRTSLTSSIPEDLINEIAKMLFEKQIFTYAFQDGRYILGMPFVNAVMDASNAFIEYYNSNPSLRKKYSKDKLMDKKVLDTLIFGGNMFFSKDAYNIPIEAVANTEMFVFKEHPVCMTLKDCDIKYTSCEVLVLNIDLLSFIIYNALKYINVEYGREKDIVAEKARVV